MKPHICLTPLLHLLIFTTIFVSSTFRSHLHSHLVCGVVDTRCRDTCHRAAVWVCCGAVGATACLHFALGYCEERAETACARRQAQGLQETRALENYRTRALVVLWSRTREHQLCFVLFCCHSACPPVPLSPSPYLYTIGQ